MTHTDVVLAAITVLALAVYLGILVVYVPHPALIVVCFVTVVMVGFDFIRELRQRRDGG